MSDRPRLAAANRSVTGKKVAHLRREGRLPAVLFGRGEPSVSISVDAHEFEQLRRHAGATTLVDLAVDGDKAKPVLIHGIQVHAVTRRPLHIDLYAVRMSEELTIEVTLVGSGHAPAVEDGGTVVHSLETVRVRALPADLPEAIHYDLAKLVDFDATVTVAELVAPEGVTIQNDPGEVIARVLPPRIEIEEAPVAAEEPEAGAEGEAEGEEAAAGSGGDSESTGD